MSSRLQPNFASRNAGVKDPWASMQKLADVPFKETSNLVWININEFLTASFQQLSMKPMPDGLWVYNIISNTWRLFAAYPSNKYKLKEFSISYDIHTNIIWLFGSDRKLITFNMRSKKFKMIKSNAKSVGREPRLVIIDHKLHVVGGGSNKHHLVWNDDKNKFEILHTFNDWKQGIYGHEIIYIPTKHVLYLIGGFDPDGIYPKIYNECIWRYNIENVSDFESNSDPIDSEVAWSKSIEAKLCYNPCILLPAEKQNNILIFGDGGELWLFDINRDRKRLLRNKLILNNDGYNPLDPKYALMCGGDTYIMFDIFIQGLTRKLSKDMISIPYELVILLRRFYTLEMVYFIQRNTRRLYGVATDEILRSV